MYRKLDIIFGLHKEEDVEDFDASPTSPLANDGVASQQNRFRDSRPGWDHDYTQHIAEECKEISKQGKSNDAKKQSSRYRPKKINACVNREHSYTAPHSSDTACTVNRKEDETEMQESFTGVPESSAKLQGSNNTESEPVSNGAKSTDKAKLESHILNILKDASKSKLEDQIMNILSKDQIVENSVPTSKPGNESRGLVVDAKEDLGQSKAKKKRGRSSKKTDPKSKELDASKNMAQKDELSEGNGHAAQPMLRKARVSKYDVAIMKLKQKSTECRDADKIISEIDEEVEIHIAVKKPKGKKSRNTTQYNGETEDDSLPKYKRSRPSKSTRIKHRNIPKTQVEDDVAKQKKRRGKRPVGRPRKTVVPQTDEGKKDIPKRKVGRPCKTMEIISENIESNYEDESKKRDEFDDQEQSNINVNSATEDNVASTKPVKHIEKVAILRRSTKKVKILETQELGKDNDVLQNEDSTMTAEPSLSLMNSYSITAQRKICTDDKNDEVKEGDVNEVQDTKGLSLKLESTVVQEDPLIDLDDDTSMTDSTVLNTDDGSLKDENKIDGVKRRKKNLKSETKPVRCQFCPKILSSNGALKAHILIHKGIKPYQCKLCDKQFTAKVNYERHLVVHRGIKEYVCKVCGRDFFLKYHFEQHKKRHSEGKILRAQPKRGPQTCKICGKFVKCYSMLQIHMRAHTKEKAYTCTICNRGFNVKCNFKRHQLRHAGIKLFQCRVCDKSYYERRHLRSHHTKVHTGQEFDPIKHDLNLPRLAPEPYPDSDQDYDDPPPVTCDLCGETFKYAELLRRHTGAKHARCCVCDRLFADTEQLRAHYEEMHVEEQKFLCPDCGKAFKDNKSLSSHVRVHKEPSYLCPHCGLKFKQHQSLCRHIKYHVNARNYACKTCEARFAVKSDLVRHEKKHLEKVFRCQYCNSDFLRRETAIAHVTRCHMMWMCVRCNMPFQSNHLLMQHKCTGAATSFNVIQPTTTPQAESQVNNQTHYLILPNQEQLVIQNSEDIKSEEVKIESDIQSRTLASNSEITVVQSNEPVQEISLETSSQSEPMEVNDQTFVAQVMDLVTSQDEQTMVLQEVPDGNESQLILHAVQE